MPPATTDKKKPGKTQFGVQSVEIAMQVVAALAQAFQPLMLRELAAQLRMPPAKVHRYLVSLTRSGMVEQNGAGGRYGLGPLALTVGLASLNQLDVIKIAGAAVADLRDRTDQTALLAIWGSAGPTVVRWEECRRPAAVNVRAGSILHLLDSATGLIFAAYLPRHITQPRIAEEMAGHDPAKVGELLDEVRARGMSRVRGHQLASVNALSAPVFDHTGHIAAAITVLGPERRINVDWDGPAAKDLKATARQISARLGFQADE
jgi:DNA-binding IclR family transcriptional regulator